MANNPSTITVTGKANIGDIIPIRINRYDPTHTNTVQFRCGDVYRLLCTKSTESQIFLDTSDSNTKIALYAETPNTTGVSSTLFITTYDKNGHIVGGEEREYNVSLDVVESECRPYVRSIGDIAVADTNPDTITITGGQTEDHKNIIVKHASDAQIEVFVTGNLSATITSVYINDVVAVRSIYSDDVYIATLPSIGSENIVIQLTDSRGITGTSFFKLSDMVNVNFIEYIPLSITASAVRDSDNHPVISIRGNFFKVNNTFPYARVSIKPHSSSIYGTPIILNQQLQFSESAHAYSEQMTIDNYVMSADESYDVKITIRNGDIGGWGTSVNIDTVSTVATITSELPIFDWGENDFRFNVPVFVQDTIMQTDLNGGSIDVYWGSNGNDDNDGLTNLTPVKSIRKIRDIHSSYRNGTMNVKASWGYWPETQTSGDVTFTNSSVSITFDSSQPSSQTGKVDIPMSGMFIRFNNVNVWFKRVSFIDMSYNNSLSFTNCRVVWDADITATCNTTAVSFESCNVEIAKSRGVTLNHSPVTPNAANTGVFFILGSTVFVGKTDFVTGSVYRLFDGRATTGYIANAIIAPTSESYANITRSATTGSFARYANVLTSGNSSSSNI